MTALVTGATGFIGRHLVAELSQRNVRLRALYRDEAKARLYLCHGEETICGDACDPAVMRQAISTVEVVYHCAAAHSSSSAEEIRRTNLRCAQNLFQAAHDSGSKPRIVLMSSINVLGDRSFSQADESTPRRLTGELHVDLKTAAEELAEKQITEGQDIVILRPGLVYGFGDLHLSKMARAIGQGKFMYLGSRQNIVPLVHVSDMVEAMILAATRPATGARIYHITDGSKTPIGELVQLIAQALGCAEPRRVVPAILPRLANAVCRTLGRSGPISPSALRFLGTSRAVDISRARLELGFTPSVTVSQGIAASADWLREAVSGCAA